MYLNTFWKDHAVYTSNTYALRQNSDGTTTMTQVGTVIQQGTNMSATNFNHMELGITDASVAASIFAFYTLQTQRFVEDDPDDYDFRLAGRLLAFGNLQQQMMNDDALSAIAGTLEGKADSTETDAIRQEAETNRRASVLAENDAKVSSALVAFGNMQQQRLNDAQFNLIASEALGESHTVTLTNTQKYPFNSTVDSPVTVALTTRRKNLFYSVEPEITANVGPVGEIRVTNKQLNGFKVSFDGCGKSVTVILRVKGGMSHG